MKSKAAIQVEPGGPLVIEEIDLPDPGPNQVTVRNFASGVCYSQVHQLRNRGLPRPMGLGHEGSGVVTHLGKGVTHVKEGDHVVVHYTVKGTEKTAEEVDRIGKDGLKASEVVVKSVDHGAKTVTVKTAEGTEETFHLAGAAAKDTGKGLEKAGKVTVFYTEDAGKKVAHFFKQS